MKKLINIIGLVFCLSLLTLATPIWAAPAGEITSVVVMPESISASEQIVFKIQARNNGEEVWNSKLIQAEVTIVDADGTVVATVNGMDAFPLEGIAPESAAEIQAYFKVPSDWDGEYFFTIELLYNGKVIHSSVDETYNIAIAPSPINPTIERTQQSTLGTPVLMGGGGQAVDIVFIMDTSGSMDDEFSALCSKIDDIVIDLKSKGITVRYRILGITGNRDCAYDHVTNLVSGATADHEEDWGPATRDLAVGYPWLSGYIRLIIPMSDEGPENGDSCDDPGPDRDSIPEAIETAQLNEVTVCPIICSDYSACSEELSWSLAWGTGGTVFYSTDPGADLANGIANVIAGIAPNPKGEAPPQWVEEAPKRRSDDEFITQVTTEATRLENYQFGGTITFPITITRVYGEVDENGYLVTDDRGLNPIGRSVALDAVLTIMAYDADYKYSYSPGPGELNMIEINGHPLVQLDETPKHLYGQSGAWVQHDYEVPTQWLKFPQLQERIDFVGTPPDISNARNIVSVTLEPAWGTEVAWARLKVPGARPVILVRGFDFGSFFGGTQKETDRNAWSYWQKWVDTTPESSLGFLAEQKFPNVLTEIENSDEGPVAGDSDVRVYIDGTASSWENQESVKSMIRRIIIRYGVDKINIVAHSKGGIDSRYALDAWLWIDQSHNRGGLAAKYVDTLVTIGTPNEGIGEGVLGTLITLLPLSRSTLWELSTMSMKQFNELNPDPEDVRIVAIAGDDWNYNGWKNKVLVPRSGWRNLRGVKNDGLIDLRSVFASWFSEEPDYTRFSHTVNFDHSEQLQEKDVFDIVVNYLLPPQLGGEEQRSLLNNIEVPQQKTVLADAEEIDSTQSVTSINGIIDIGETNSHTIRIEGTEAAISLNWFFADDMGMTLYDPEMSSIDPTEGSPSVTYTHSLTDKTISYLFNNPLPGEWTAEVTVTTPYTEGEDYFIQTVVSSNIQMQVFTEQDIYRPQESIRITTSLIDDGTPVVGAIVSTTVSLSETILNTMTLYDDGVHSDGESDDGIYGNAFTDTIESGYYLFETYAEGEADGTLFSRLDFAQAMVMSSNSIFTDHYLDAAVDIEEDGFINSLIITTEVQIVNGGEYRVLGSLVDPFNTVIANASTEISTAVPVTVDLGLVFDGEDIAKSGLDGPYSLQDLYLTDNSSGFTSLIADYRELPYTTTFYTADQFQCEYIVVSDVITDTGIDSNGNGKFESLQIGLTANFLVTDIYTVTATLADQAFNGITTAHHSFVSNAGSNDLTLDFNGPSINLHGADGPYCVKSINIQGSNELRRWENSEDYVTQVYSYTQFEEDMITPTSSIAPLPEVITTTPIINVRWLGDDPAPGAGIAYYDVQYRVGSSGTWTDWLTQTKLTAFRFGPFEPVILESGQTYYFQIRAVDHASNYENYLGGDGDAHTTMLGVDAQLRQNSTGPFIQEHEVTYQISYKNYGPIAASNVIITDTLPEGFSYVTDTSGITPTVIGNTVIWPVGTMGSYSHKGFEMTVVISSMVPGDNFVTNTLDISTVSEESNYENNKIYFSSKIISATRDMYVSKSKSSGLPIAGREIKYRILYGNGGNSEALDVIITDTLPFSMTYVSDYNYAGFTPIITGNTVIWIKDSVASGESGSLYLTARISDTVADGTILTNTVEIVTSHNETNYDNNLGTEGQIVIPATRDMYVSKYKNSGALLPESELRYKVSFGNGSNTEATNVVITDILPSFTSFVEATDYHGCNHMEIDEGVVWNCSTVEAGDSGYQYLTVFISDTVGGTILTNTVLVSSTDSDMDYTNNIGTDTQVVLTPTVDMHVSKSLYDGAVVGGNDIEYRLYYRNYGNSSASNVVITDTIPELTEYLTDHNYENFTTVITGDTVVWTKDSVLAGDSGYLYLAVRIPESVTTGEFLTNVVHVSTDSEEIDYTNNVYTDTRVAIEGTRDMRISKSVSQGSGRQGDNMLYRLYYKNDGNAACYNVVISDTLPPGMEYVSFSGDYTPTVEAAVITWELGRLAASESGYLYLTAHISDTLSTGTILTNTAEVATSSEEADYNDNISINVQTVSEAERDLTIAKSLNYGTPIQGTEIKYRLEYRNLGHDSVYNITITDTLPVSTTFVSQYSGNDWEYSVSAQVITWTVPFLEGNRYGYVYVTAYIDENVPAGMIITNIAEVGTTNIETDTTNNTTVCTQAVEIGYRDLTVDKSLYDGVAAPGNELTYRIRYKNEGNSSAVDVILTDTLSADVVYVDATGEVTPTVEGNSIVWELGRLNPGDDDYAYVTVRIPDTVVPGGVLDNMVSISTSSDETNYDNNADSTSYTVITATKDMYISKSLCEGTFIQGTDATYRIYYRNYGNSTAHNVRLVDTLPLEMTYISHSGEYTPTIQDNQIIWNLADIPGEEYSGCSGYLYVTGHISNTVPAGLVLTNTIDVSTDDVETNYDNNFDTDSHIVLSPTRDIAIFKSLYNGSPLQGTDMTYQIEYENEGNSEAAEVIIVDTLPLSVTYLSHTSYNGFSAEVSGNVITWTRETFAAGDSGYQRVSVNIPPTVSAGTILTNQVIASTAHTEVDYDNNMSFITHTVLTPAPDMLVSKELNGANLIAGADNTYTIHFENQGTADAQEVMIEDTLPVSTTYVSSSGSYEVTTDTNTVAWDIGNIGMGNSYNFDVTVHISDNIVNGTVLTNVVNISTVDKESNYANNICLDAHTVLSPDIYEPDDIWQEATWLEVSGITQTHNFHAAGDDDWASFEALAGAEYVIETTNLGDNCNTKLYLYDTDGVSQIDYDDDGGIGSASRIVWTASSAGIYFVKCAHYSSSSYGLGTEYDLTINIAPVYADFTASPTVGLIPLHISFANTSSGNYTDSLWNFGDGDVSTHNSPTHTYTAAGTYTVALTVSGPGVTDTLTRPNYITAIIEPVQADFTAAVTTGVAPLTVDFVNLSTGNYAESLWNFGDGMISNENEPTHNYNEAGVYTVTLTVSNTSAYDTLARPDYITVTIEPVQADFTVAVTTGVAPLTVDFVNLSTGNYAESLWNFGDGMISDENEPTHTYTEIGVYTVILTATGTGGSDTKIKHEYITVENELWRVYLPLVLKNFGTNYNLYSP